MQEMQHDKQCSLDKQHRSGDQMSMCKIIRHSSTNILAFRSQWMVVSAGVAIFTVKHVQA